MTDFAKLFAEHLALRQRQTEGILAELGLDALVIGTGSLHYYPEDDMTTPFKSYHHFNHWCPLKGENHALLVRPGQKPVLYYYSPADYWYEHVVLGQEFWAGAFDVHELPEEDQIWGALRGLTNTAYIGPDGPRAKTLGLKTGVPGLLPRLDWERSFKAPYEIACAAYAQKLAAPGHRAAKKAFLEGGSELDIHHSYLAAVRATDHDMPYDTIVCLNEKAAVLHYHFKRDDVRNGKSMLIDAGARFNGYASDITRTYAAAGAHPVFHKLLTGMEKLQQSTCAAIKPGLSYEFLHGKAQADIAALLVETGVLKGVSQAQAVEQNLAAPFFPHGLGHQLGIFVHDVAGKQLDRTGTMSPPSKYKYLRTNRTLGEGNFITVEPGLYFIEMLLAPLRASAATRDAFDWKLIEELKPCGGIRIEDDVVVTAAGYRNLTREQLPD